MNKKEIKYALFLIFLALSTFLVYSLGSSEETNTDSILLSQLSPKEIENSLKMIKKYIRDGRDEEALIEAQKLVELAPQDIRGYKKIRFIYLKLGRYEDASRVSELITNKLEQKNLLVCGDIEIHAWILEYEGNQDGAIEFLDNYRLRCSDRVEKLIVGLQKAISNGTKYFPSLSSN